ncbi:thioredoxin [bacterium]|nr:thioredoxin [bacterium]MBU1064024.1 thioredoxin [bacterium]MBU1635098.1 thioredoxin [bacterium]MBU1875205.1 thioredoxin [bacterium]
MFEFTDANFKQEVIRSDVPVLVDFWAAWCMPCKKIAPIIEELSKEFDGKMKFGKVNVENNKVIPQQYGIRSIPTLLIFKNGQVFSQLVGMQAKRNLEEKIREAL